MALDPFGRPWPLFSFLTFYIVGRTPWMGDYPATRLLSAHTRQHEQNKCTQTTMSQVGFEPTIAVFEGAKTVHDLDLAASAIGHNATIFLNK
jgi:hypothetical protein